MNLFGHHRKFYKLISFDFSLIYFSCVIVNFCLSSGLSTSVVFVSFLCGILASAFYKYTIHRERMLTNQSVTTIYSTKTTHPNVINDMNLLSEIENTEEEEEEIQTEQIKNIYHLLNDDNLTTRDFLEQLKMYGVQIDDKIEHELS